MAFSRHTYANKWQKRFEEDLVEVLTKWGNEPKATVRLVVSPIGSRATRTLENVPMSEANRRIIYGASVKQFNVETDPPGIEQQPGMRRPIPSMTPSVNNDGSYLPTW